MKTLKCCLYIGLTIFFLYYWPEVLIRSLMLDTLKGSDFNDKNNSIYNLKANVSLTEGDSFNQLVTIEKEGIYQVRLFIPVIAIIRKKDDGNKHDISDMELNKKLSVMVNIYKVQSNEKILMGNNLNYLWDGWIRKGSCVTNESELKYINYEIGNYERALYLAPGHYILEVNTLKLDNSLMSFMPTPAILMLRYISNLSYYQTFHIIKK